MSQGGGTRSPVPVRRTQHGAVLLGLAGGMLVVAAGFAGTYYVIGTRSEARAATLPVAIAATTPVRTTTPIIGDPLKGFLAQQVDVQTATGVTRMTWGELGIEADAGEVSRTPVRTTADLASLGARGALPVKVDRDKAVTALLGLKLKHDKSPINAYLDLEARQIHDDSPGQGIDVWGSLPRISAAARQAAPKIDLLTVAMPATVTKATIGIDDISHVMGHYETKFSVSDKDRNFNLKLAASKVNGYVMKPHEEWSFNGTVGERSQKMGYKVAHVITAGEMVDGLAGGTCQISTTLFGASFFAGLDVVRTTNHSRPSVYTPLGFDATVVWPDTDLVLRNPYDFPVVLRYVVANGEAKVEILGKERPYDRIEFERKVIEETPYSSEERLDEEMPLDQTSLDQAGFNGYLLERYRRFYKGKKVVKTNKWQVRYKPVTEYIRRGTNPDPLAKMPEIKEVHSPKPPKGDTFTMSQ